MLAHPLHARRLEVEGIDVRQRRLHPRHQLAALGKDLRRLYLERAREVRRTRPQRGRQVPLAVVVVYLDFHIIGPVLAALVCKDARGEGRHRDKWFSCDISVIDFHANLRRICAELQGPRVRKRGNPSHVAAGRGFFDFLVRIAGHLRRDARVAVFCRFAGKSVINGT